MIYCWLCSHIFIFIAPVGVDLNAHVRHDVSCLTVCHCRTSMTYFDNGATFWQLLCNAWFILTPFFLIPFCLESFLLRHFILMVFSQRSDGVLSLVWQIFLLCEDVFLRSEDCPKMYTIQLEDHGEDEDLMNTKKNLENKKSCITECRIQTKATWLVLWNKDLGEKINSIYFQLWVFTILCLINEYYL